jgi:hypothetical protein
MARGKKGVVFPHKKRTARSNLPENIQERSSSSLSWSSSSSCRTLADAQLAASASATLMGSVIDTQAASNSVQRRSSTASASSAVESQSAAWCTQGIDMPHSPAAVQFRTHASTSKSTQSDFSLGGAGVGSVPASLIGGTSLFYPDQDSPERRTPPRARPAHPSDVGTLYSTSVPISIRPLPLSAADIISSSRRGYNSRRPAPPGLPTVLESYAGISITAASSSPAHPSTAVAARTAKLSSTLGRHTIPPARSSSLRHAHCPGPTAPRFPPIQHEPPNPEEHGTAVQKGFPGVEPKEEPILNTMGIEKDPVVKWREYRAYLAELKKRHGVVETGRWAREREEREKGKGKGKRV